jgi:hypothetical protein
VLLFVVFYPGNRKAQTVPERVATDTSKRRTALSLVPVRHWRARLACGVFFCVCRTVWACGRVALLGKKSRNVNVWTTTAILSGTATARCPCTADPRSTYKWTRTAWLQQATPLQKCHCYSYHHYHYHHYYYYHITITITSTDRLCGLVVRVPGYKSRDPGFDSRGYNIFWEVVGLERSPLNLMRITGELLEWKTSGSVSRKSRLTFVGIVALTTRHSLFGTNFANTRRSLGRLVRLRTRATEFSFITSTTNTSSFGIFSLSLLLSRLLP